MYYEINVSENGKHLFATAPRSITTRQKLQRLTKIFAKEFRESEGFKISISYREETGKRIDVNTVLTEFDEAAHISHQEFIHTHPNWEE